jgi:hypothetical protein
MQWGHREVHEADIPADRLVFPHTGWAGALQSPDECRRDRSAAQADPGYLSVEGPFLRCRRIWRYSSLMPYRLPMPGSILSECDSRKFAIYRTAEASGMSIMSFSVTERGSGSLPLQLAQPQKIAVEELKMPDTAPMARTE